MKTRILILISLFLVGSLLFSCKDKGGGSAGPLKPAVSGATNELMVIMPKALWQGPVGDTLKTFFGQAQPVLPQAEPMFDLINLPPAAFDKNVKSHRNVLIVRINKADTASVIFHESPWARTQKLFKITAPNIEEFYKIFDENKEKIMGVFLKAERDRLISVYKKTASTSIFNIFKDKYRMLLYCPGDYRINKDTNNFVWISAETKVDSRGIIFFEEKYEDESQLNFQIILDRVNEELKKYIPGPRDESYMALDMVTPMTAASYNYEGVHYALLIRGLWIAENDYMGGPFILNVVLDQQNERIIYMMGYVYAPDGKKRNMLRQVEGVIYSMQLDLPEEKQAPKKQ